jgi:hypothetical protein
VDRAGPAHLPVLSGEADLPLPTVVRWIDPIALSPSGARIRLESLITENVLAEKLRWLCLVGTFFFGYQEVTQES